MEREVVVYTLSGCELQGIRAEWKDDEIILWEDKECKRRYHIPIINVDFYVFGIID